MAAEPREFDELENVDIAHTREEFRCWLENNHGSERECWLKLKRGRPTEDAFAYLDAVEEALCFGWIDGHLKSFEGCGALQQLYATLARKHRGRSSTMDGYGVLCD